MVYWQVLNNQLSLKKTLHNLCHFKYEYSNHGQFHLILKAAITSIVQMKRSRFSKGMQLVHVTQLESGGARPIALSSDSIIEAPP